MRLAPGTAVVSREDRLVSELPSRESREQLLTFARQDDVARPASLAFAYRDDAGVSAEIRGMHRG
jgi:hypothetical protein